MVLQNTEICMKSEATRLQLSLVTWKEEERVEVKVLKESWWGEYSGRRKNLGSGVLEFLLLNTVVTGSLKEERHSL